MLERGTESGREGVALPGDEERAGRAGVVCRMAVTLVRMGLLSGLAAALAGLPGGNDPLKEETAGHTGGRPKREESGGASRLADCCGTENESGSPVPAVYTRCTRGGLKDRTEAAASGL